MDQLGLKLLSQKEGCGGRQGQGYSKVVHGEENAEWKFVQKNHRRTLVTSLDMDKFSFLNGSIKIRNNTHKIETKIG